MERASKASQSKGPKSRGSMMPEADQPRRQTKKAKASTPEDKGPQAQGTLLPEGPHHLESEGSTISKKQPKKSNDAKDKGPKARGTM